MFDMLNIMGKAREAKTKLEAVRADQQNMRASATSAGGLVSVTVDGDGQLVDLVISPELFQSGDADQLSDLIVLATNEAIVTVKANVSLRIKQETEGLLPNIPGFDLGSMLG